VTLLAGAAAKGTASLTRQAPDLGAILVAAWLAGAAVTLGVLALRQARSSRPWVGWSRSTPIRRWSAPSARASGPP
jgi:hypothetical protein